MTRGSILPALAVAVAAVAGCRPAGPAPGSRWIGQVTGKGGAERLEIVFDSTRSDSGATVSIGRRVLGVRSIALATGRSLRISVPAGADTLHLDGRFAADGWEGTVTSREDSLPFAAVPLFDRGRELVEELAGSYRSSDGRIIGIGPFAEFGTESFLVDYRSGRIAPLIPVGAGLLLTGSALIAPLFPAGSVTVTRNAGGAIGSIELRDPSGPPVIATRIPTRDTAITFSNGTVTLAATLTFPEGPGPHPAIVLVHGSNAQPRETFGPWQRFFAAQGFAVLAYDKRGTGSSTGDWKTADFPTLASDALAGVRFLAGTSGIRKDRVGLWGISQAGWLLPRVAADAPDDVAFLIVHAGTGTTVREQGILNLRQELRASGLPDSAVALAVEYRKLDDRVTETGAGLDSLQRFYDAQRVAHPWLWPPSPLDAWFRGYYRMLMPYDPAPDWRRVRSPVLLLFGELDVNVPPAESWPPIERGLALAGNQRVSHVVLPRANHVFLEAVTGGGDEYPGLSRFVPEYFDRMADWLAAVK